MYKHWVVGVWTVVGRISTGLLSVSCGRACKHWVVGVWIVVVRISTGLLDCGLW